MGLDHIKASLNSRNTSQYKELEMKKILSCNDVVNNLIKQIDYLKELSQQCIKNQAITFFLEDTKNRTKNLSESFLITKIREKIHNTSFCK